MSRQRVVVVQAINFMDDVMRPILDDDPLLALDESSLGVIEAEPGKTMVLAAHTMIGGRDFSPIEKPRHIAPKLLRICLAELASRGAMGRSVQLSLCLSEAINAKWIDRFGQGLADDMREFGISVAGSDLLMTSGSNVLSMTCVGEVEGEPMNQNSAELGQVLCLSGSIGSAQIGRTIIEGNALNIAEMSQDRFVQAFESPTPHWALGSYLQSQVSGAAAVNVKSGFLTDLNRFLKNSGVAAMLLLEHLPFADPDLPIGLQLDGSPDQQLLFSVSADSLGTLKQWFPHIVEIGHVIAGDGVHVADKDGNPVDLDKLLSDRATF